MKFVEGNGSSLLLTHVSVKFELILSSKPYPDFKEGHVCNWDYSSKFDAAKKDNVLETIGVDYDVVTSISDANL